MALSIYQTQPRLVFSTGGKVYKFFNIADECRFEVESIMSSPMSSSLDSESKYTMALVKIISSHEVYYVMKVAGGDCLTSSNDYNDYYLAGRWLRTFHETSKDTVNDGIFLFGDYVASHLYIDNVNREVTLIDPGKDFGRIGKIEEDIARFIVGLFLIRSFNITKLKKKSFQFIHGYGVSSINFESLDNYVEFRVNRSFEKAMTLNTGFKRLLSAYFWRATSKFKYCLLKQYLRVTLGGD